METYRYTLDKSSKKYRCPSCLKNAFVLFTDSETGDYLPDTFGKCDRLQKCGFQKAPPKGKRFYFFKFIRITAITDKAVKATEENGTIHIIPISQIIDVNNNECWISEWYLKKNNISFLGSKSKDFYSDELYINTPVPHKVVEIQPSYHPLELLDEIYVEQAHPDYFTRYLKTIFSADEVKKAISDYFLTGTNKPWTGSTIFWQIDEKERIHSGKIMLYNETTGKRIKEPYTHVQWMHKVLNKPDFQLQQCLFGLHRINEDLYKTIAITESEKTAVILSIVLPEYIWLACGGAGKLKSELLEPIKNRAIVYFPDKGLYNECLLLANNLNLEGFNVSVSKIIEGIDVKIGADLADVYLSELTT